MGYDGKGQAKIRAPADIEAAYAHMKAQPAILESFLVFDREVSVIGARAVDGTFRAYDVTDNEHRGHILHRSLAPAPIPAATADEAIAITRRMADALDYVGVLAVEFFVLPRGQLVVNEIAPRVHNSGHWTLGGAQTSQFEQHIRAVAGWPLGDTTRRGAAVEMINLIGDEIARWPEIVAEPGTALHHYGKRETRPGRKMGHVTRILARYPTLGGMDSG
jgi:5-(carboxyamino)imidazole ribonucleotide synthase